MIDPISAISLVLSILIVGCFFLLLIMQVNSFANKKIENPFFIIALIAGSIGITSYTFAVILDATNPNVELTNNLHSYLFFFFTLCFYFWYKHYEKIITLQDRSITTRFNFLKKLDFKWLDPITTLDILFYIGLTIDLIYYVLYLFHLNLMVFGFIWHFLGVGNTDGRMVTVFSLIAFLSGLTFFYITYIIITNNLVELSKVPIFEVLAIIALGFSNAFLLINDIFVTFGLYPLDLSYLIVGIGLLIVFLSLIMLLINYILLNPSHVTSPSLFKDIVQLINAIDDPVFETSSKYQFKTEESTFPVPTIYKSFEKLSIPQKLNVTYIIILIYLMKNYNISAILAKDLEANLNLNKSTISYNLKILENNEFINRISPIEKEMIVKSDLEVDQRQKFISINENGRNFLLSLQQYLNSIF